MNKFIETLKVNDYSINTDNGFVNIENIGKTIEYEEYHVITKKSNAYFADEHLLIQENYHPIKVIDLYKGCKIIVDNVIDEIVDVYKTGKKLNMFDLQLDKNSNCRYYVNDILSHNSMWMHNIAANISNTGKNVLIVTLEMADYKVLKRLDCIKFDVSPKTHIYEEFRKNKTAISLKFKELKLKSNNGKSIGKLFVKKFPTSKLTITDLDVFIKKVQDIKNIKIDIVFVDYITIMGLEKGLNYNESMLYLKGKHLAEGLRYIADKHNICVVTATQTSKDVWDANDLNLKDIPESKGIAEAADDVIAIIRNPEMKKENKYRLKPLKRRDGEMTTKQIEFDFNTNNLRIENDRYFDMEEAEKNAEPTKKQFRK